jgi:hypothetical protein
MTGGTAVATVFEVVWVWFMGFAQKTKCCWGLRYERECLVAMELSAQRNWTDPWNNHNQGSALDYHKDSDIKREARTNAMIEMKTWKHN